MFSEPLLAQASAVLDRARTAGLRIATAESCTGGLIAVLLTEISGSSDVVEGGFVTYSNDAKCQFLGVSETLLTDFGAVSEQVARAMAEGVLKNFRTELAVAVTGIAGPGGGSPEKPVGLVHIACASRQNTLHQEYRFGDIGRGEVRLKTVEAALEMLNRLM